MTWVSVSSWRYTLGLVDLRRAISESINEFNIPLLYSIFDFSFKINIKTFELSNSLFKFLLPVSWSGRCHCREKHWLSLLECRLFGYLTHGRYQRLPSRADTLPGCSCQLYLPNSESSMCFYCKSLTLQTIYSLDKNKIINPSVNKI